MLSKDVSMHDSTHLQVQSRMEAFEAAVSTVTDAGMWVAVHPFGWEMYLLRRWRREADCARGDRGCGWVLPFHGLLPHCTPAHLQEAVGSPGSGDRTGLFPPHQQVSHGPVLCNHVPRVCPCTG